MSNFRSAKSVRREVAEIIRPPRRMKVSTASEKYVNIVVPGGYSGPFKKDVVPYMTEPADMLSSRKHKGLIFVGPAQSAKTQCLIDNWLAYTIMCDPADMTVIQTSQSTARDFSKRRMDRMHRNCPDIQAKVSTRLKDDNTYDKYYRTGQIITLGWPSINVLSGKAIKYMALTDLDRMDQNIDGEGSPFDLATKRTTTFGSAGMTLAESSPGFEIIDKKWKLNANRLHEAPPTFGILALYNRGDRRRWYWPCPNCNDFFEGSFANLSYDEDDVDLIAAAESVVMLCPACNSKIEPKYKRSMNADGSWLGENRVISDGKISGEGIKSDVLSYWLKGPAAAFQSWKELVVNFLQAYRDYERTGNQEALKTTVNVDQSEPYQYIKSEVERDPQLLEARAVEMTKRVVPIWVRFLIASFDVQKKKFVVQVHGFGVGLEQVVIDRFSIALSHRYDDNKEAFPINPGGYLEDWDLLIDKVILKSYPIAGGDCRMKVLITGGDSGGAEGVTDNAYKFWKKLKRKGIGHKLMLVKGGSSSAAPRIKKISPDSSKRKDRHASAFGDVPVYMLNTNLLKDKVDSDLSREEMGPGYIHFPAWLGGWFYEEMTAEERTEKGWKNLAKVSNEAFDLFVYIFACIIRLKAEKMNWENPFKWAQTHNINSMVVRPDSSTDEEGSTKSEKPKPKRRKRRRNNFVTGYR